MGCMHVRELLLLHLELIVGRRDDVADHQRAREEPALRADEGECLAVANHARLLLHLAQHALLERLAKLGEARQRRVPPFRPRLLAAEQALLAARDEDDDRGIEARPEARAARGVDALAVAPVPDRLRLRAARRAELDRLVPQ